MIKLRNLQRRMRCFNLEHPTFKNAPGNNGAGKPEAMTMLALETVDVHEDTLLCREVKAALNPSKGRPTLRVLK